MKRAFLVAAFAAAIAAVPARADTISVNVVDHAFSPARAAVLAGDRVGWRNSSILNEHTVSGNGFDSGPIVPGGGFFHEFPAEGTYPYVCTIHPFMAGEVDAYGLLLSGPGRTVARGAATTLTGRAAAGVGSITVEEDTGGGFRRVATAQPQAGSFRVTVRPPAPAIYRAVAGESTSPPLPVEVTDRSDLTVKASGRRVRVRADPPNPGARVSLQLRLRERFGWWTVARARLDRRSEAQFPLRRRKAVWARVVLTQKDGWTSLAASAAVRVRPRR